LSLNCECNKALEMRSPSEIAESLSLVAELMELNEENPFKIRAYQNASEIIAIYTKTTEELLGEVLDPGIPKIGKNLAQKIQEYAKSEETQELKELLTEVPLSLLELKSIPGLGAKKVRTIWKELRITELDQLESACLNSQISALKGFGEKIEKKILEAIESRKKQIGWNRLPRALELAQIYTNFISKISPFVKVEVVGSLKRSLEVIDKVELLISGLTAKQLQTALQVESSLGACNVLEEDLLLIQTKKLEQIYCHFCELDQFGIKEIEATGSPEFVTWFKSKSLNKVKSSQNQIELFASAKIEFVAPELREPECLEDWGVLKEQSLLKSSDLRGIIHAHSTYSDGVNTLKEMAEAAQQQGYSYLGISDHSVSAAYAGGLSVEKIKLQQQEIDQLNQELSPFKILKGIESDIRSDGSLDYEENILESFDFVIASVHSGFQMTKEQMTARIVRAIKNPYTTILGHPTGRLLLEREAYALDLKEILEEAAKNSVIVEINSSPYRLDLDWRWVRIAKKLGVKFSINPDSHRIAGYSDMEYGVRMARKAGLGPEDILNCRELRDLGFKNRKDAKRT
jgi:DNA polymerase (family 10)